MDARNVHLFKNQEYPLKTINIEIIFKMKMSMATMVMKIPT